MVYRWANTMCTRRRMAPDMISYDVAKFLEKFRWRGIGFAMQVDGVGRFVRKAILWFDFGTYTLSWRVKIDKLYSADEFRFKTKINI